MTCRELTDLVTSYIERRLPFGVRLRLALHLLSCLACRRYVRQMRLTIASLGRVPAPEVPEQVRARLQTAFRDWQKTRTKVT